MVRPDPFRDRAGAHEDLTGQGKSSSGKRAEPCTGHVQDPSHMSGITAWPKKGGGEKKKKAWDETSGPLQTRAGLLALNLLLLVQGNDPPSSEADMLPMHPIPVHLQDTPKQHLRDQCTLEPEPQQIPVH